LGLIQYAGIDMQSYADACVHAFRKECRGDDCGELASLKDSYGQLLAGNVALKRWKSTNAPRLEALQGLLEHAQIEAAKGAEAIASLESERAANTILTDETAALRERVRVLEDALRGVLPWVVTEEVACNGLKCREAVCMSCDSDSKANAQLACDAYCVAHAALNKEKT
jgi:hypothetical protein